MSSIRFMNDPEVTPEDAVKVINALAAPGAAEQIAAGAAAVVGAAGEPIATADLAATTGRENTLYVISDGEMAGAKLVWAVPSGGTDPTWCWWLWPQSAVEI